MDLDDRLNALGGALEDPRPRPKATIERRASQLRRRRRLAQAAGTMVASVGVVLTAGALLSGGDDGDDTVTDASSTTTPPPTTPTTAATTPTTTSTLPTTTTSAPPPVEKGQGGLTSATAAIRAACRRFYGFDIVNLFPDPGEDTTGTSLLTEQELVGRCDEPQIEFHGDCYAARPATFVAGDGGCAELGGYLAVFYGEPPESTWDGATGPMYQFPVGDDVWWIYPESD